MEILWVEMNYFRRFGSELSGKGVKGGVLLLTITEHGQYAVHVG